MVRLIESRIICRAFILFVLMLLVHPVGLSARSAKDVFAGMPEQIYPLLTQNNRLDLIDFMESKMPAKVKNVYNEDVELLQLTDNYILLQTSKISTMELLLLPFNGNDTIICKVNTLDTNGLESEIEFYSKDWGMLQANKFMKLPQLRDFLVLPNGKTKTDQTTALSQCDIPLIVATIDPQKSAFHFRINLVGGFLDLKEIISPYIKEEIVAVWKKNKFVME